MGSWMGGWRSFPPPIDFIFWDVNKHKVVILKMGFKVVNGYYIKSYDHFKSEIW